LFDPNVGTTFLITLVYFISFGIFITSFQPFAQGVLSLNPQWISFIFSFFGLIGIISQVFFVQRLSRFFGLKKAFTISLGIVSIGFLLIGLSNNLCFSNLLIGCPFLWLSSLCFSRICFIFLDYEAWF
jgi:MFS family permease